MFFVLIIFCALTVADLIILPAYANTEKVAQAPVLDFFVSLFTWIPWVVGGYLLGWEGVVAAIIAQVVAIHASCLTDKAWQEHSLDLQHPQLGPLLDSLRNDGPS